MSGTIWMMETLGLDAFIVKTGARSRFAASRAIIVFVFFFILAFFALVGAHQSIRGRGSTRDTGNCSSSPVENR
ncbi:hypothetical protein PENTCL1PPCAC_26432 [Pristionchus entomophagus]|uniref:Uncharacterized protein n=1 Tax=Pristionchus entomophagus TaxID=358040 RepID=A0AAV5UD04_9BILA|nr:hypothetical protein PENTCL1PPCAC_26432 [Pristionchus entomophagus]